MRLIFHNPHVEIWYKTPLYHALTRRKSVEKYSYLLDYYIEHHLPFAVYVDGFNSSIHNRWMRKLFPPLLEYILWTIINRINPFKIKLIRKCSELKRTDILFSFLYGNFSSHSGTFNTLPERIIKEFSETDAYKILHLTHYMYNAGLGSHNSMQAKIDLFVCENNLYKNSQFFRHFFPWYQKDVYVLPFVPKKRFANNIAFQKRKNKAIATGTITFMMKDKDFLYYYNTSQVHPMRAELYNNRSQIAEFVDCYISDISEGRKAITVSKTDNIFKKFYAMVYYDFIAKQKKYFSFDIVQKYNDYTMFIVPEEINDLPGIGFVEGMACGSAYIGKRDPMYADIGMIDGVHFIGYDGTLQDLLDKIRYYQSHEEELENIARQGSEFAQNNFRGDIVAQNFVSFLSTIRTNE